MDIDYILNTKPNISFDDKSAGLPTPNLDLVQTLNRTTKSGRKCTRKFNKSAFESYSLHGWQAAVSGIVCFASPVYYFPQKRTCGQLDAKGHASSRHHKLHSTAYVRLRNRGADGRIETALSEAFAQEIARHNKLVECNRAVLSGLVDCVLYLGIHELAFRGDDESEDSLNRGNFKDLHQLLTTRDPRLRKNFVCVQRGLSSNSK